MHAHESPITRVIALNRSLASCTKKINTPIPTKLYEMEKTISKRVIK